MQKPPAPEPPLNAVIMSNSNPAPVDQQDSTTVVAGLSFSSSVRHSSCAKHSRFDESNLCKCICSDNALAVLKEGDIWCNDVECETQWARNFIHDSSKIGFNWQTTHVYIVPPFLHVFSVASGWVGVPGLFDVMSAQARMVQQESVMYITTFGMYLPYMVIDGYIMWWEVGRFPLQGLRKIVSVQYYFPS